MRARSGRFVCIALLFLVMTSNLMGGPLPFDAFPRALGVQVGRITGIGLSYQRWFGNQGYQVAAGALYHPRMDEGHDIVNYNMGAEYMHAIYSDDFSTWLSGRLYLFAGLNHRGYKETVASGDSYVAGDFHPEFGMGAGVGVETVLFEHFAITTEMAYAVFYAPTEPILHERFVLDILPQISLRYRFR